MNFKKSLGRIIWIVCPVYLDVESFLILRQRLITLLNKNYSGFFANIHFVVVDDTADTDEQISKLTNMTDVTIIYPPFNLGHQRAIVFGLRTLAAKISEHDVVITMDSDGEDRPEDLPKLLTPLLSGRGSLRKVVLAKRTKRKESLAFKIFYFFFKVMFRSLTGLVIQTGNYAAYHGWLAKNVLFHPHFDLCYSSSLISLNLAIDFIPCERGTRYAGQSRMSYLKLIMHGFRMLMPFIDRIAVRALIGFTVLLGSSLIICIGILVCKIFFDFQLSSWASFGLITSTALSFIALGNFIVLFTIFSESRGSSLSWLDRKAEQFLQEYNYEKNKQPDIRSTSSEAA
jgi:polyisoprenyl-phosphate glycosyltransferase